MFDFNKWFFFTLLSKAPTFHGLISFERVNKLFRVLNFSPSGLFYDRQIQWGFWLFSYPIKFRYHIPSFQFNLDPPQVANLLRVPFLLLKIDDCLGIYFRFCQFSTLQIVKLQMTYSKVGLTNHLIHLFRGHQNQRNY